MSQDDKWSTPRRFREARIDERLSEELMTARHDGAAVTLILAESVAVATERLALVSESSWYEIASRRLLVGDDWACELAGGRKAFCLTHTGPESDPAIHTVFARLDTSSPLVYGIAHYPGDAKTAQRLIEVAGHRLDASRPVTASNR